MNNQLKQNSRPPKVFAFGELLLRYSPAINRRWIEENNTATYIGGAELNVATALAKWELPVKYCTALPSHYLADEIIDYIALKSIDTTTIHRSGHRIGTYYLGQGKDLKNAAVIYDRAYSSFAELKPGMINWYGVLKDCTWFHFSAINPALNELAVEVCMEALTAAQELGLIISIDLNYRAKLWQYGKKPPEVMEKLIKYCDVIMGNIWAANTLLNTPLDESLINQQSKTAFLKHATHTANALFKRYTKCCYVAQTFRFDQDKGVHYYAALNSRENQAVSPELRAEQVVDKIGSGDCFMAGLILGFSLQYSMQDTINYSALAAFGKMQEKSDATNQTKAAILQNIQATLHNQ